MEQKSLIVEFAELIARHWPGYNHVLRRLLRVLLPHPGTLITTLVVVGAVLFAQRAGALPSRAPLLSADSTTTISYQGRLTDSGGNPITSSGIGMQFCLYDTNVGGSPVGGWCENHTSVPVEDGLFHVLLGSTNPIPVSLLSNNTALWLGITVGADSEMSPREQVASVPYAVVASKLVGDGITTNQIADGAVTSAKLEHSGPHIPITPDENGLIKMAVLRQDNTTDSYRNNQVILTGYGYAAGTGTYYVDDTVDMGVIFSDYPIVLVSFAGIQYSGGILYPDTSTLGIFATAFDIDYSTFRVRVQQSTLGNAIGPTDNVFYTWIAIGTLE